MKQSATTQIDYPEKAADYFKQGYNCAQSVLLTMQELHGQSKNELIPKIATAFGAGIGRCGDLCGALTGATMAIGLGHGTNQPALEQRLEAYRLAQQLYQRFIKEFGTSLCRELIGYDLNNPQELEEARRLNVFDEKCVGYVKKAVEILLAQEV